MKANRLQVELEDLIQTRIPTRHGEFVLHYYQNNQDSKEHIALVLGDVTGKQSVPVRIHSECFTGDVIGSTRCDCGDQLTLALRMISAAGAGVLIYLRQEGRGIGFFNKLQAYNLQDQGYDTVEANIHLGYLPDEREYFLAASMLKQLGIESIHLITNNPDKLFQLTELDIKVEKRIPIKAVFHKENMGYIKAKVKKMHHFLDMPQDVPQLIPAAMNFIQPFLDILVDHRQRKREELFLSLSYAQSIDGSIALNSTSSLPLSSTESLVMTHILRAHHDALLVGINTILVDDPQLNVRHFSGSDPQPVILDCLLRFPEQARVLEASSKRPIIVTTKKAPAEKKSSLEKLGIRVYTVKSTSEGRVNLEALSELLLELGIKTVMVEGGGEVINEFFKSKRVDYCVITIAPKVIGGLKAVEHSCPIPLEIKDCQYHQLGSDLIVHGAINRDFNGKLD